MQVHYVNKSYALPAPIFMKRHYVKISYNKLHLTSTTKLAPSPIFTTLTVRQEHFVAV